VAYAPHQRRLALKGALEARLLRLSVAATFAIAALGVLLGLLSDSMAIVFDGFFSLIDAGVTWLMLLVARLVARESNHRFQYGYWHLEPLVLALRSSVLLVLNGYALAGAIRSIAGGGYLPALGMALVYSALTFLACLGMWAWLRHHNARISSELVRIDGQSWLMSALISASLLLAFGAAQAIEGTRLGHLVPYADPLILGAIAVLLLPVPVRDAWRAFREIFEISPPELDAHVRAVMRDFIRRHGFLRFESYVSKTGRARFIEVSILVPPDLPALPVAEFDRMRREIGNAIGGGGPERWLTISFTADPEQL
jgi:predicted Co/Zn/Cd cation transporter (cation efflux family)